MPIYEYECTNCHQLFDILQKISDEPTKQCPQCLQNTAIRLVSAAGFQLKGSGWYATDFKNKAGEGKKKDSGAANETPAVAESAESATTAKETATTATNNTKAEKD